MDAFHPALFFSFLSWGVLKLTRPHGPGLEGPTTHPISQRKDIPQCELSCSQLHVILCIQLLWAKQTSQRFSEGDCWCPKVHRKDNYWDFQIFSTGLFPKLDSFIKLHCCHLDYLASLKALNLGAQAQCKACCDSSLFCQPCNWVSHAAETRIDISSPFLSLAHNLPLALIDMSSINSNPLCLRPYSLSKPCPVFGSIPEHGKHLILG